MASSRNRPSYWVLIVLLVIAHLILRLAFGLGVNAPDLLTVAVLLAARRARGSVAAAIGLGLGVLNDALSLIAFGAEAVTFTLIGYIGARSRDLFEGDSHLFVWVYVFLGKWIHDVLYTFIAGAERGDMVGMFLIQAPIHAAYAAFSAVVALMLYRVSTGDR